MSTASTKRQEVRGTSHRKSEERVSHNTENKPFFWKQETLPFPACSVASPSKPRMVQTVWLNERQRPLAFDTEHTTTSRKVCRIWQPKEFNNWTEVFPPSDSNGRKDELTGPISTDARRFAVTPIVSVISLAVSINSGYRC